jgi:hypothetical protein
VEAGWSRIDYRDRPIEAGGRGWFVGLSNTEARIEMQKRTPCPHGGSPRVRIGAAVAALVAVAAVIAVALPAAAGAKRHAFPDTHHTRTFWQRTLLRTATATAKARPALKLSSVKSVHAYGLNRRALHRVLATAPAEFTRAARLHPAVVSLPGPDGRLRRCCRSFRRQQR